MSKKFIQREIEAASKDLEDIAKAMEHEIEQNIEARIKHENNPDKTTPVGFTSLPEHWIKRLVFVKDRLQHVIEALPGLW
jgi:hypothetical protein